jgi:UDP-2-acetamido-2-deoxy-ribo-hexuluronate aminotransferase
MQFTDLKRQYAALKPAIDARLQRVLDHGQYILGPEVVELEEALAGFTGAKHCVTVASGTEALLIALMALDLPPGFEVLTTPFTFAATAEMVVLAGGVPVFCDIEADTANLDVRGLAAGLTPRTKVVMPVSLYGQPADMDAVNAFAAAHGLVVIEDAAQSFGATYRGRRSCALSTFGATSFFPSKPLGCYGDGGALFTDDARLAEAARRIRVHGQAGRYHHVRLGVGGRLDTLQAAVLLAKLPRFTAFELDRRQALAARYERRLDERVPGLPRVVVRADRTSAFAQFTVFVEGGAARRDAVAAAMQAAGVPTAVHYPRPLHHQPAYAAHCCPDCCPNAVSAAAGALCLPMSADLAEGEQDTVVEALAAALQAVPAPDAAASAAR